MRSWDLLRPLKGAVPRVALATLAMCLTGCAATGGSPRPAVTFAPVRVISTSAPATSAPATSAPATSAPATSAPATSAPLNVVLTEYKVDMPATVAAGQDTFTITNSGTIQHEMLVFKSDLDPAAYPKNSDGDIDEEGPGVNLISDGDNIDVGGTQTRTVDLTAPGKYLFVCNIPGHFAQGMFTVVIVH